MLSLPEQQVFRFAPSPNGLLHLGHAYSALLNADLARSRQGRFLLRIEDIDKGRARREFIHQIEEDLAWLGVWWEEPVMRQSRRFSAYKPFVAVLEAKGLVYPCFASRAEIAVAVAKKGTDWPKDPDGTPLYPGLWRHRPAVDVIRMRAMGLPHALRLDMEKALDALGLGPGDRITWQEEDEAGGFTERAGRPSDWGDVVIARKDVPISYHAAVVVDDHAQGVTRVVRGKDIEPATVLHRLLQDLLGLGAPVYRHHRLILDGDGKKLSKSDGAVSLKALREAGKRPSEIRRMVGL